MWKEYSRSSYKGTQSNSELSTESHKVFSSLVKLCATKKYRMEINEITRLILEAAYKVHSALGPGLLESSYRACLAYEIRQRGLHVETEVALPLVYEEIKLDC